ncbi:MAG: Na+/H+ antiporter subunit E [Ilumatobacter sp.]|uniref:Na+/H+ antiporter subunit E n=1 Tax=Ilumatobacter sp. TaxID=1967498 RepID=UPI003C71DABB
MRTSLRLPMLILWLTILWVLLWGDVSAANVLGGFVVAIAVVLFARLDSAALRPTYFRPWWALRYVAHVIWELLTANLRLAYEILTPKDTTFTGIIAVPIRGGSDAVVNLVANSITLTPGTMTIDVKRHDRDDTAHELTAGATLYVHGMFMQDVEAVRHDILRLEALALHAFGTNEEYERALSDVVAHEPLLTTSDTPPPEAGR